mgnify:CR=1 FL=1
MIPIPAAFSGSYAEARTKFLEGAASLGLRIHSHLHPLTGRDGETLAMDVVRDGPADADRLLRELVSDADPMPDATAQELKSVQGHRRNLQVSQGLKASFKSISRDNSQLGASR